MPTTNQIIKENVNKAINHLESAAFDLMTAQSHLQDAQADLFNRMNTYPNMGVVVAEGTQLAYRMTKIEDARKMIEMLKSWL